MTTAQQIKHILVIQSGTIGEVAIASPFAHLLKRHNPLLNITWITSTESAPLLQTNPDIDELIIWENPKTNTFKTVKQSLTALFNVRAQLAASTFDTVYDLQSHGWSTWVAVLSGAKQRIALGSHSTMNRLMHKVVSRNIANSEQIGAPYRYLVNQLGYTDAEWPIRIYPSNAALLRVNDIYETRLNEEYMIVNACATTPAIAWPEEHWQQLLLRARGRYKLKAVILSNINGNENNAKLARKTGALHLEGINLQEAHCLMSKAKLIIGVDNNLTHLAQSLNTPCIALFGATRPYLYSENKACKIMYLDEQCSPCGKKPTCKGAYTCMANITPDMVLGEIKQLFKRTNQLKIESA